MLLLLVLFGAKALDARLFEEEDAASVLAMFSEDAEEDKEDEDDAEIVFGCDCANDKMYRKEH